MFSNRGLMIYIGRQIINLVMGWSPFDNVRIWELSLQHITVPPELMRMMLKASWPAESNLAGVLPKDECFD